jgi:nicotinic acid phosphoribosyltransferase
MPQEITKRQVEYSKIDKTAVKKCEGRHFPQYFHFFSFEECIEKLYNITYTQEQFQYLQTSAVAFADFKDFLEQFTQRIEVRRLSLLEIKSTLVQLNTEI